MSSIVISLCEILKSSIFNMEWFLKTDLKYSSLNKLNNKESNKFKNKIVKFKKLINLFKMP